MTYNVRACLGLDRVRSVRRIVQVMRQATPDIAVLQELDVGRQRSSYQDQALSISEQLDLAVHFTETLRFPDGRYGLAVLSRAEPRIIAERFLPQAKDEPRAAQWVRFEGEDASIDLVHAHLSVRPRDRGLQIRALLGDQWLGQHLHAPHLVVCGDLNATPRSFAYRALERVLRDVQRPPEQAQRARATWPASFPMLRLDHIFVGRGFRVLGSHVPMDAPARRASDHLPVVADLEVLRANPG